MSQTWDDTLRASGYRVTPQRQLVLEAVTKLEHATPEEIFADVQQTARGVNVSTIYRTLELLEQLGLVTHTHLGHGAPRYHLAAEAEHVHLVCRECGQITEVDPAAVGRPGHRAGRRVRFRDRRRSPDGLRPLRRLPGRRPADRGLARATGRRARIAWPVCKACSPEPAAGRARRRPRRRPRHAGSPRTTATRTPSSGRWPAPPGWSTGRTAACSRITGPDRLSWLHSLTTQAWTSSPPVTRAEALILSPNGHVEHHLTLTDDGTRPVGARRAGHAPGRCWSSSSPCGSCSGSSPPT